MVAKAKSYTPEELKHLNNLVCTTNETVCPFCLGRDCNGTDCGDESPSLASAKAKFFSDGSYEEVLHAKLDLPNNMHGHTPFNRQAYLASYEMDNSEGANTMEDTSAPPQEDVCLLAKADPKGLDRDHDPDDEESDSDESSIEEDDLPIIQN
jgi:hypothetical protein